MQNRIEMAKNQRDRPSFVTGPLGERLTIENLPPANTTHWVIRRKAEVVAAVNGGLLTLTEACARYKMTIEEFSEWRRAIDRAGVPGLRVTQLKRYREPRERPDDG